MNVRTTIVFVGMAMVAAACGCAAKREIVPSSGPRSPTSPEQVRFYQKQPLRYEILGTVTASKEEGAQWDDMGNANEAFDLLKAKAAELGANGLLLDPEVVPRDGRATLGYHNTFYQVAVRGKLGSASAVAQAIYVFHD